ncbi:MAG: L-histidine N(alpha)-methyltransferase [Cytophagaceae bacterium]|nr:L-histidine N(alpha)-methyltransferase [Gemmatimonadaceae bacterium]
MIEPTPAARPKVVPHPVWTAHLRDCLERRQKELPMALFEPAVAVTVLAASDLEAPFVGFPSVAHLERFVPAAILFVDAVPSDARLLEAMTADRPRICFVAHRVPSVARGLGDRVRSWGVATEVHAFTANTPEDLIPPMPFPRPLLIVVPGNALGTRGTIEGVRTLRSIRAAMKPGDRLILVLDVRTDARELEAAYGRAGGAWERANAVVVQELARVLSAPIDTSELQFAARHDRANARVEGVLVAHRPIRLAIPDGSHILVGRHETLRTVLAATFDRRRLEGTLRGCGLQLHAWHQHENGTAVAVIDPVWLA